jgi:hypothetical protein
MTARVVQFSGGVGSWAAAKRVAAEHGTDGLILLFADTLIEDEDLYRFLGQAAADVGGELVKIAEGRDPWQVFFDERFLGNTRIDPCSKILKRELLRAWLEARYQPDEAIVYLGIDWTEAHRFKAAKERWSPYRVEAPLCERPLVSKPQLLDQLRAAGIEPPRLYRMGFPHNNCGGFCIKAGQGTFAKLLEQMPERYAYHERREQELREYLGKDVAILRDREGGETRPLTLRQFRERREAGDQCDLFDLGGCGCVA